MIWTQDTLVDRQRSAEQRLRLIESAHVLEQHRQVIETARDLGMIRADVPLVDGH